MCHWTAHRLAAGSTCPCGSYITCGQGYTVQTTAVRTASSTDMRVELCVGGLRWGSTVNGGQMLPQQSWQVEPSILEATGDQIGSSFYQPAFGSIMDPPVISFFPRTEKASQKV